MATIDSELFERLLHLFEVESVLETVRANAVLMVKTCREYDLKVRDILRLPLNWLREYQPPAFMHKLLRLSGSNLFDVNDEVDAKTYEYAIGSLTSAALQIFRIERDAYLANHPCRFLLSPHERPAHPAPRLVYLTVPHDIAVAPDQRAIPMAIWMEYEIVGEDVHRRAGEIIRRNPNTIRAWLREAEKTHGLDKRPGKRAVEGENKACHDNASGLQDEGSSRGYRVQWNPDDPHYWAVSQAVEWAIEQFDTAELEGPSVLTLKNRWSTKNCGGEVRKDDRKIHFMATARRPYRTKVHIAEFKAEIRREIDRMKRFDESVSDAAESRLDPLK